MSAELQAGSRRVDVAVAGGGHNGLVAACMLAREGLEVVLLERAAWLGGMTASRAFVERAPEHLLSPGAYENVYLRASGIVADLELERFGYRELESAGWAWLGGDGRVLRFERDVDATARAIMRFSVRDARAYRELVSTGQRLLEIQDAYGARPATRPSPALVLRAVRSLTGDRAMRALLGKALGGTLAEVTASTFESEEVRGAFMSIGSILAAPNVEGSGLALLSTSLLHRMGAARPVGGMGGLIDALERCLVAHGGTVRTGAAVERLARGPDGSVAGVELEGGETLAARAVVAAIPPQRVAGLLEGHGPAGHGDIAERLRRAPANASGVGTLTVNLALEGRVGVATEPGEEDMRKPTLFTGSFDDVMNACSEAAGARVPARIPWCAAIFTAIDESQAPEGQDVLQLYGPAPVSPGEGWDSVRDQAASRLVEQAGARLEGLAGLEIGRYVETPADLSARTGCERGCIYHVDHLPTRLGPLRPARGLAGDRTPLRGLYLSGAGTHPGGGVSGLPGMHAARAAIKGLR